jgi:hypothetical protein
MRQNDTACWQLLETDVGVSAFESNTGQKSVLATVAEFIENPDSFAPIPSFVRLERPKGRQDIRWQILTAASAYHVRFELRGGVGDREIAGFGFPFAAEDRGFVSEIIERGPQVLNGLDDKKIEFWRCMASETAFVRFCQSVRIRLDEMDIRVTLPESSCFILSASSNSFARPTLTFAPKKGSVIGGAGYKWV